MKSNLFSKNRIMIFLIKISKELIFYPRIGNGLFGNQ